MTNYCLGVCCGELGRHICWLKAEEDQLGTLGRFTIDWKEFKGNEKAVEKLCSEKRKNSGLNIFDAQGLVNDMMGLGPCKSAQQPLVLIL
jgi:hypothetical protein